MATSNKQSLLSSRRVWQKPAKGILGGEWVYKNAKKVTDLSYVTTVVLPTRSLAQPLSNINAIDVNNILCDPAPVPLQIREL